MPQDTKPLTWSDIWRVISPKDSKPRDRASRETAIVVAISLLPLILGAFLAWVHDHLDWMHDKIAWVRDHHLQSPDTMGWAYLASGMLGGQLFLVSLSLSGTNFSRLWDPQAARVNFSGVANSINVFGALITAGLLGLDPHMTAFNFFPVNVISASFMVVAVFHYFCLAVPGYIESDTPSPVPEARGRQIAKELENG